MPFGVKISMKFSSEEIPSSSIIGDTFPVM
jgi:hypothetical protein